MAWIQRKAASFQAVSALPTGAGNAQLTGVTAGNTLVLVVVSTANSVGAAAWPTPTDSSGDAWSLVVGPNANGNSNTDSVKVGVWWRQSASAGTHTLTQSMAVGSIYGTYAFLEVAPCSAVDVSSGTGFGNTSVTTGSTGSVTTTQANDIVVAGLVTNTSNAGLASTGFTDPPAGYTSVAVAQNTQTDAGAEICYRELSATGSQSVTWTWTNTGNAAETAWASVIAAFKPTAAPLTPTGIGLNEGPPRRPPFDAGALSRIASSVPGITGTASVSEAADTLAATGLVSRPVALVSKGPPRRPPFAAGPLSVARQGAAGITGTASVTEGADSVAAEGLSAGIGIAPSKGPPRRPPFDAGQLARPVAPAAPLSLSVVSCDRLNQAWSAGAWTPTSKTVTTLAGDIIIAWWDGWTTGSVVPQLDGSTANWTQTIVNQETGGGNGPDLYAGSAPHTHLAAWIKENASAGSHTITPPVLVNGGGDDGNIFVMVVRGGLTSSVIRAGTINDNRKVGAGGFVSGNTIALAAACQAGDLVLAFVMEENTAGSVSAGITDPPSGWTSQGVDQDATNSVPAQLSSKIASSAGTQSVSWTWTDPNTNQTSALIFAIASSSTPGITGTASVTEGADAASGAGALAIAGTSSVTEGADTTSATGALAIAGTSSTTEGADTVAGAGVVTATGTSSTTEGADTASGSGALAIAGTASITEGADNLSSAGALAVAGTSSVTEGADTLVATGVNSPGNHGDLNVTEGADTLAGAATVAIAGAGSVTEGADTASAAGALAIAGTYSVAEGADTLSAAGTSPAPPSTPAPARSKGPPRRPPFSPSPLARPSGGTSAPAAPAPSFARITVADATVTAATLTVADATAIATALAVLDATTNAATVTADDPGPYSPQIVFLTVTFTAAPTTARLRLLSPSGALSTLSLTPLTATTFSAQADLEGVGPWRLCADDAATVLCKPGLLTLTASSDGF